VKYLWLLLMLWAGAACATTFNVTADSILTRANAQAVAGDLVNLAAATYTVPIEPAHNGTADTSTGRIRYVGRLDNYGATVSVPSMNIYRRYITVLGVKSRGNINLQCVTSWDATHGSYSTVDSTKIAYHDSVSYCTAVTELNLYGAKNCVVYKSKFGSGAHLLMNNGYAHTRDGNGTWVGGVVNCAYDVIRQCNFDVGAWSDRILHLRGYTQYCTIDSNRFTGTFTAGRPAGDDDAYGRYLYQSYYNEFKDNYWKLEASGAPVGVHRTAFSLRDSTHDNLFLRDTMLLGLDSGYRIGGMLVNNGITNWLGQNHHNRYSHCYYLMTSFAWIYDKWVDSSVDSSVFASRYQPCIYTGGQDIVRCRLRHNSFYTWTEPAISIDQAVGLDPYGNPLPWRTCNLTMDHNIYFTSTIKRYPNMGGCVALKFNAESQWPDSMSNYNVYWSYGTNPSGANTQSCGLNLNQYDRNPASGPYCHDTYPHMDCDSKWGNPGYSDTTLTASGWSSFSPRINSGSPAALMADGDYAGAFSPYCSRYPDTLLAVRAVQRGGRDPNTGAVPFTFSFRLPASQDTCMVDSFLVVWDTTGCAPHISASPAAGSIALAISAGFWRFVKPNGGLAGDWQEVSNIPLYYGATEPAAWNFTMFQYIRNPSGEWTILNDGRFTGYRHCP
jgi:hypothetical protein